ncbi:MAG: class I SAM-dependent methyltransferase [Acidobacteriota bacterium]
MTVPVTTTAQQIWETAEICQLCGSQRYQKLFSVYQKDYVQCSDCQVSRLYHRIAFNKLDLIYQDYYTAESALISKEELANQLANPTFLFRRKRLERFVPVERRNIYEIGCGDGNFLAYLRNQGWQIQGCEYGLNTFEFIKARHNIEVAIGDFATLSIPPGSLDVIGSYAVLEHLYTPRQWIKALRQALKPGGWLHLQLPNFRCWERYLTRECWGLLNFPQHVYFYSPAALSQILAQEGFETLTTVTYDPWHSPATTLASARNLLKRLLTGKIPWSLPDNSVATASIDQAALPATTYKKTHTQLFDGVMKPVATVLAHTQNLFGFGNIIDIIARVSR